MLARYINQCGVQLPITRLGNGFYMFGTRRIFAKISNNKLIVRVGGGFTSIDEFITQYGEGELTKIKGMNPEQLAALHTPNGLKNVVNSALAK
jgi:Growth-Arrest-Specific Protein 2 Domain